MNPTVSVIIPCFNQARFLSDCIASLQAQTYPHWEAIIVNDGSPDNTREVALKLSETEPRIRYIEQENRGLSGARNSGVAKSRGDFLQFLDSDDVLESDKLRYQVEFLQRRPEIGIVYGDVRYFKTGAPWERAVSPLLEEDASPWIPKLWAANGNLLSKLAQENIMAVNCALLRRSVMERIGSWNENLEALEDWEYWIRCASAEVAFEFSDYPRTYALVRLHALSMTKESTRMLRASFDLRIFTASAFSKLDCYSDILKTALYLAEILESKGRSSRYWKLFWAFTHKSARRRIINAYLVGPNSLIKKMSIWYERIVPWPIQKMLMRKVDKASHK